MEYSLRFLPEERSVTVPEGTTVLDALRTAGLWTDAPCGGRGTCGKCRVTLDSSREVLACQTRVDRDLTVCLRQKTADQILTDTGAQVFRADGSADYTIAFDLGTTTIVGYLSHGGTGACLQSLGCPNPQSKFGADVISRIEYVLEHGPEELANCVKEALTAITHALAREQGISPGAIGMGTIVGNTAMHHLLLSIDPRPLITPPYMPLQREAMVVSRLLPIGGPTRVLPNIAGFVGADTVGCLVATRFDSQEKLTLLIDIGTNGELVLGNCHWAIAASTAAGPAFEGARISCGMRGTQGAIDHVFLEDGKVCYHVLGEGDAQGLCGSGLLDLIAVLLQTGAVDGFGRLEGGSYTLAPKVTLTQKDVREVQLAKAAIRAGMELLAKTLGVALEQVEQVYLAGAFGNYLDPRSACAIGMFPPSLLSRIVPIGNAAGAGARLCSLEEAAYAYAGELAAKTEFLELAGLPEFQDAFVDALTFEEEEE